MHFHMNVYFKENNDEILNFCRELAAMAYRVLPWCCCCSRCLWHH